MKVGDTVVHNFHDHGKGEIYLDRGKYVIVHWRNGGSSLEARQNLEVIEEG